MGIIINIFISEKANKLPVPVDVAETVTHRGLSGDRYYHKTGTYSDVEPKSPGRELTLIELRCWNNLNWIMVSRFQVLKPGGTSLLKDYSLTTLWGNASELEQ